jgi:hypothetical protein
MAALLVGLAVVPFLPELSESSEVRLRSPKTHKNDGRPQIEPADTSSLDPMHLQSKWIGGEDGRVSQTAVPAAVNPERSASNMQACLSPGLPVATTYWEYQHNNSGGHQIGRVPGSDVVHFTWTEWDHIPVSLTDLDRFVHYGSYSIGAATLNQGFGGAAVSIDAQARGGFSNLAIDPDNTAHVALHQLEMLPDSRSWALWFPIPGVSLHIDDQLGETPTLKKLWWPKIEAQRNTSADDIVHVISHAAPPNADLVYWRYNGSVWQGPVLIDQTPTLGYVVTADETSNRCAIVFHYVPIGGLNNVAYYESATDGTGWLTGTELGSGNRKLITNYNSVGGPQAWVDIAAAYDHNHFLHVVWDEQRIAGFSEETAIQHWTNATSVIRPVTYGYWSTPLHNSAFDLSLSKLSIGIGDGSTLCQGGAQSNNNYVYVLYTKFGGKTAAEQNDASSASFYNGELWLTSSNSGGNTWSPPTNLTNTKTPGCDPTTGSPCCSENWATVGKDVGDLDILYVADKDAGSVAHGEGTWTNNDVLYLRLPGGATNAQYVCPVIAPVYFGELTYIPGCPFSASTTGSAVTTLTIRNVGNATLTGSISVVDFPGLPTLTISGGGAYSIVAGGPDLVKTVTMAANGAGPLTYFGAINVSHSDPTQTSPDVFPVTFVVSNTYICNPLSPAPVSMATNVASPGSLRLAVTDEGRFGAQEETGGLWRSSDGSSGLYDGSLLVAHGTQIPGGEVVFHHVYDAPDPGQSGFRARETMQVDSSAYHTGHGYARTMSRLLTADSAIGVDVTWYFPQHPDSDEFIIASYKLYTLGASPATDVHAGVYADFDLLPAERYGSVQHGVANTPGSDGARNLVWQQGTDTAGHVVSGSPPNTATRYRAGIRVLTGANLIGAEVGVDSFYFAGDPPGGDVSSPQPKSGQGVTSNFLYASLNTLAGIKSFTESATDLYTLVVLARGQTVNPGETLCVAIAVVSDTVSESSFKATSDAAREYARALGACGLSSCTCPCKYDPICDGIVSDVLDVVSTINVAFRGQPLVQDPGCPNERTDIDASGATDVIDVTKVINVAFRGQTVATNYVDPCL